MQLYTQTLPDQCTTDSTCCEQSNRDECMVHTLKYKDKESCVKWQRRKSKHPPIHLFRDMSRSSRIGITVLQVIQGSGNSHLTAWEALGDGCITTLTHFLYCVVTIL